ncbi:MAG: amidohydrolase [Pirellulales bacterium]
MLTRSITGWILSATAMYCCSLATAQSPDAIYHHAQVLTVDNQFTIVEAFAVTGERITALGSDEGVLKTAGPNTKLIDLEGKTVIPGLMDSHVHAAGASVFEYDHPVPTMNNIADVLDYIRSRAAVVPPGNWIVINQVFITRLAEQRFPTRAELDAAAPNHPVCFRTGPDASLNSLALAANKIDENYRVPDGVPAKVEIDPTTGRPTGILRNHSRLIKVGSTAKDPDADGKAAALEKLLHDYNSVGITSIAERSVSPDSLKTFQNLFDNDKLSCRVFLNWSVDPNAAWPDVEKQVRQAIDHPLHTYNDRLWLRGVKVFLDGGMLTGSAYMRKPWGVSRIYSIDDPEYRGLKYIEPERLYQLAKLCLENDLQFTAHSVGDGAVDALIAAYEQVNESFPVRPARPCITHCNFMSREAIEKMQRLGITADLQPVWLWLDGVTLEKQFGVQRLSYFQPYRALRDAGVIVGGGSDHMQKIGSLRSINPYNPFLGMWIPVNRIPRGGDHALHSEQKIDRREALRLYTIDNAFVMLDEKNRGSLEVGKLADFAVLADDFLKCSDTELRDMQVLQTFIGGKQVYAK